MYLKERGEKIEPDIVEELTESLLSSTITEEEIKRAEEIEEKRRRDLIKGAKLVHNFDEIELEGKKISDTEYQIIIRPKR